MNTPDFLRVVSSDGREILLLGTAHVSRISVEQVEQAIREAGVDTVAVELDEERLRVLDDPEHFRRMDVFAVLKAKRGWLALAHILISAWQRKLAAETGVEPGSELKRAADLARQQGLVLKLMDRPVAVTLRRAWNGAGFLGQLSLLASLGGGDDKKVDEAELERLRSADALAAIAEEMAKGLPSVHRAVLAERDEFMALPLLDQPGRRVLAVVGAAHLEGIARWLASGGGEVPPEAREARRQELLTIPPGPRAWSFLPWLIPALVAGLVIYGISKGRAHESLQALLWYFAGHSLGAALGALVALASPLTILAALVFAPVGALHIGLGVGVFSALTEAWVRRPRMADFEAVGEDSQNARGWWKNRLLRVFLVFALTSFGGGLGNFALVPFLPKIFGGH